MGGSSHKHSVGRRTEKQKGRWIMRLFFVAILGLILALPVARATETFCIVAKDPCCDGSDSRGETTHMVGEYFEDYYISYDSGNDENNGQKIQCAHDGFILWEVSVCGCGDTTIHYPTNAGHVISITTRCQACPLHFCMEGESVTKVYHPANNACHFDCVKP
jgi:hypothetical protein